jgi:hypothetical protein
MPTISLPVVAAVITRPDASIISFTPTAKAAPALTLQVPTALRGITSPVSPENGGIFQNTNDLVSGGGGGY